mmetsp:Transcript_4618/g.6303  ORF Transcript_4618/g.6303 Transcript_4618/m.6303 type:complete len:139 (+) Transcript_4618:1-417(+)
MNSKSQVLVAGFFATLAVVAAYTLHKKLKLRRLQTETKAYCGSCHCKNVQFEVIAPKHLVVWDCNCSICKMKKNWHFIVPNTSFQLLSGKENTTEYKFNSKVARHMFCSICGVQSYYFPRSNPDGGYYLFFPLLYHVH